MRGRVSKGVVLTLAITWILALRIPARGATTQGAEPDIAPLVAEALARSPDLAAARERTTAARERIPQAGALPDPTLSIGYENDGWAPSLGEMEMTKLSIVASQTIPFPGKRGLRTEIEDRAAEGVGFVVERSSLGIEADVVRAYSDLLLARKILDVIDEQQRTWTDTADLVRTRYAVGQGAQQDVLRIQVELTRVGSQRAVARGSETSALAALNRLRDRPPDSTVETKGSLSSALTVPSLDEFLASAYAASPDVRAADSAVREAEKRVELARLDTYPDFSVSAGYMNRGSLEPMWQAGFGLTLPIWANRKQAKALAEAEASLRAARQDAAAARLLLRERSQERIARLKAALETAGIFENGILPQDEMSVEAALANYRTGQVPFVTVLEALSALYRDRIEHLGALAEARKIRASLEELDLSGGPVMAATARRPGPATGAGPSTPGGGM